MDYQRIYREFIADRRDNPALSGPYTERHHIVPRWFGGGDEPENLIDLLPEDHFFAHLLLARLHGGKMCAALLLMMQAAPNHWGRRFSGRRAYGLARRIAMKGLSEAWSGESNPLFNATPFRWWNYRTDATAEATIYEMWSVYGGSRPSWTLVVQGKRASILGWLLEANKETHRHSSKGGVFSFVNRDGRTFSGTQKEFCDHLGVSYASGTRVVRNQSVTACGWRLEGTQDRRHGAPKDGRSSGHAGSGRSYDLQHRDGRTFTGTAADFRKFLGMPDDFRMDVRLSGLRRGAAPTLYGWSLVSPSSSAAAITDPISPVGFAGRSAP